MSTLFQIVDKRSLWYVDDGGDIYESNSLEELIKTSDGFKFRGMGGGYLLYTLDKESLFTFQLELRKETLKWVDICFEEGKDTSILDKYDRLAKYLEDIEDDIYFYWEDFIILGKIEEDVEVLDL